MDILYRRIVHTARSTGLGVEGALEHTTEDGRRDLAPVEVERGVLQERIPKLVGELRNVYLLGEEATVGIGESGKCRVEILASLVGRGVEHLEELHQGHAHEAGAKLCEVVMKHVVLAKHACILGIETEHQAHT